MPKLWNDTIQTHRRAVHDATLDATAALVAAHGLPSVTMSAIAEKTGIGRATLYKYFPDIGSILAAWHERLIAHHLARLLEVRDQTSGADRRLEVVLLTYAQSSRHPHGGNIEAMLHQAPHVAKAHEQLTALVCDLLVDAARDGSVRNDIAPEELAAYCLHALGAAGGLSSEAAVGRLVSLTLSGLRSP